MLLYAASEWKINNNLQRAVEEQKLLSNEILPLILALNRGCLEMTKFAGFAPVSGKGLEKAAEAILDEANSWMQNSGGNPQLLRQKQLMFNTNARKVHAELLGLQD